MIKGGYILQPRVIDEHGIMKRPPIERELWLYLLRHVNHADNGVHKRGSGLFQLSDIAEDLKWYVGNRPMKYKIPALSKALRRLCEGNATATARATRGIVITILNYDYYQDPNNYEGNSEGRAKEQRRKREGNPVNNNVKNVKNDNTPHNPLKGEINLDSVRDDFKDLVNEWIEYRKEIKKPLKTQKGLTAFYNRLLELSESDPKIGRKVIDNAIAGEYQSIYPVQEKSNTKTQQFNGKPIYAASSKWD